MVRSEKMRNLRSLIGYSVEVVPVGSEAPVVSGELEYAPNSTAGRSPGFYVGGVHIPRTALNRVDAKNLSLYVDNSPRVFKRMREVVQ